MGNYEVKTKLYSDIIVYKNGIEFLKLKRSNSFFKTKSEISSNGKLLLKYDYFTFLCLSYLKIILNKFPDKFILKKRICNFFIIIDTKKVSIKYSLLPLNKTFGKIMHNHNIIGKITQESIDLSNVRYVSINDSFEEYDLYILMLLLIELTHIDSE